MPEKVIYEIFKLIIRILNTITDQENRFLVIRVIVSDVPAVQIMTNKWKAKWQVLQPFWNANLDIKWNNFSIIFCVGCELKSNIFCLEI